MSTDRPEGESPHDSDEQQTDTIPTIRPGDRDGGSADDEITATPELTTRGHPDDTEWRKHTTNVWGRVESGIVAFALDDRDDAEDLKGSYEIHPSDPGVVNLSFNVGGVFRGVETTIAGTERLTPKQAEGLAAALLEAAEQARNGGVDE
jgi:hypothetical protein